MKSMIFFLDPPFSIKFLKNLDLIKKKKMFNLNHIVIVHREAKMDDILKIISTLFFQKHMVDQKLFLEHLSK